MKRIINYVFERLFFVHPFKTTPSPGITPCSYTTTMPCDMAYEDWKDGGWAKFLDGRK